MDSFVQNHKLFFHYILHVSELGTLLVENLIILENSEDKFDHMQVIRLKAAVEFLSSEAIQSLQKGFIPNLYENGKSLAIEELLQLSEIAFKFERILGNLFKNIDISTPEGQIQQNSQDFAEFLKRKIIVSF